MRQSHFEHVRVSMETGKYTHAPVSRQENTAENHNEKKESRFLIFLVEILGSFPDEKPQSPLHTHGLLSKKALLAVFLLVLAEKTVRVYEALMSFLDKNQIYCL